MYRIGIDIGGQSAKCGVVDDKGKILARKVIRTDSTDNPAVFVKELAEVLKELVTETHTQGKIAGIGVGAPDANCYTGCIENAANLTWGRNNKVRFAEMLSDEMDGLNVCVTNDANAAAMGEMIFGAAKGMKDFIVITLGTGLGSGIVSNGKLVCGHDGLAGELGYTIAVPDGRPSACGLKGCLEEYASATGLARTAKEWLETSDEPSTLRDLPKITSRDVYEAAVRGDSIAKRVFDYTGAILGRSFGNFVAFSSPEAIILFGGLAESGEMIYRPTYQAMNENLPDMWKNKVKLLFSGLDQYDAAILGAAALVSE